MCGIFGFFGFEDKQLLDRMHAVLLHRGPDHYGKHVDGKISIGSNRLAIIDLAHGNQPLYNEDGDICVVANCEIYNFRQVKLELEKKGHRFATNCDTEVIVHAYEEWGADCPKHLKGDFVFAVCDYSNKDKKLFLARDRFGVLPLFYHHDEKNKRFIFASEIKGILEYSEKKFGVSKVGMLDYFTFLYVPEDRTIFDGIRKVMPGESITVEEKGMRKSTYFDTEVRSGKLSAEEAIARLKPLLKNAVESQTMSDVPIGVLLSGGLDSSIVTALLARYSSEPVHTYTVNIDEVDNRNAMRIVDKFGTDHHPLDLHDNPSAIMKKLPKLMWHNDALVGDPTMIPVFLISELAQKDVKVVLTGEGTDDFFAGYSLFRLNMEAETHIMHNRPEKRWARYVSYMRDDFTKEEKDELLGTNLPVPGHDPYQLLKPYFHRDKDILCQMMDLNFKNYMAHDLLYKVNISCMANSVESRVPMLDLDMVDFMNTQVPSELKLHKGVEKWVLREAANGIVPKENALAVKRPFAVPIEKMFGDELRSLAYNMNKDIGVLNSDFIKKICDKNKRDDSYSRQLWGLFSFAMWHKIHVDKEKVVL